jgi:hypothetical protein
MRLKIAHLVAAVLLALVLWLVVSFFLGVRPAAIFPWAMAAWLCVAALALAARKASAGVWIVAGLLTLAALFLPPSWVIDRTTADLGGPYEGYGGLALLLLYSAGLMVAAVQLGIGLRRAFEGRSAETAGRDSTPRLRQVAPAALVVVALGALILAKALYNFYWFLVWDGTHDPLGYLWLAFPVLVVLLAGCALAFGLPGRAKWAGAASLLLIPILIAVAARAVGVDFRVLTEQRAERVCRAIEA